MQAYVIVLSFGKLPKHSQSSILIFLFLGLHYLSMCHIEQKVTLDVTPIL